MYIFVLVFVRSVDVSFGHNLVHPGASEGGQAVPSLVSMNIVPVTHSVSEAVGDGGVLRSTRLLRFVIFVIFVPATI